MARGITQREIVLNLQLLHILLHLVVVFSISGHNSQWLRHQKHAVLLHGEPDRQRGQEADAKNADVHYHE